MTADPIQERDCERVPLDTCFEILAHERRQYVLRCLEMYETPLALADLADEVARLEHGVETLAEIPRENIKRIYMQIYHSHIPKLEDAGLLEYHQETDTVESTQRLSNFAPYEIL